VEDSILKRFLIFIPFLLSAQQVDYNRQVMNAAGQWGDYQD
jgi:hypothetical protein